MADVIVTVDAAQVPLPRFVAPLNRVTVATVSQDIVKSGVVSLVMLSVFELPVSVAVVMSGVPVTAGAVVSIVTDNPELAALSFPAVSV